MSYNRFDLNVDFDTVIERRNSGSVKWDKYQGRDVIPMWVADMDFRSPAAVIDALHRRVDHGVFGYGGAAPDALVDTLQTLLARDYGWHIDADWLVWLPGLVCGLNVVCRAVGEPGDGVLTTTPVYHHLFQAPPNFGREPITVPLAYESAGHRWSLDMDRLNAAVTPRTRLFMLCNPHNPVGRVYTHAELAELAALCERHDLVICADEIHCQLILDRDKRHIPIASLDPAIAARTVTLMAPSKTYNIPGLGCAFAIIPDPALRKRVTNAMSGIVPHINVLGFNAALAAYRDSDDWLASLLDYLRANRDRLQQAVAEQELPGTSISPVEATYLAWLDLRNTGIERPAAVFEAAGVGLSDGRQFRDDGFLRLNFGCSMATLNAAIARMGEALTAAKAGITL